MKKIRYPLIEITDWVVDSEKAFLETYEEEDEIHTLKESEIKKNYTCEFIDSNGAIIKKTNHRILNKRFSLFGQPKFDVLFQLENTGRKMTLSGLKYRILTKAPELYCIKDTKVMTLRDFKNKIYNASTYEDVITIASFMDE